MEQAFKVTMCIIEVSPTSIVPVAVSMFQVVSRSLHIVWCLAEQTVAHTLPLLSAYLILIGALTT